MSRTLPTSQHALRYRGLCLAACFFGLLAACGAKQEKTTTRKAQTIEHFECVPERWSEPPESIGETPPKDGPNARDIDPFLTEPTPKKD